MNAIDKVIGYFSPERGYRRAQYRAATQVFAYDGAKSGRRTDGWIAAGGDANSEVGASLTALRKLREPNYAVQWTAPKFESVDPLKDAMAELKKIRTGTLTLTEAIAQNGYDPEKQCSKSGGSTRCETSTKSSSTATPATSTTAVPREERL
jgi:capsid protein